MPHFWGVLNKLVKLAAGVLGATLLFGAPASAQGLSAEEPVGKAVVPGGMASNVEAASQVPAAPQPTCEDVAFPGNTGTAFARQSPQRTIAWGIYMHDPALDGGPWTVDVYVGNKRVDHKQQNYAPHGSVAPAQAVAGQTFRLEATHVDPKGTTHYIVPNGCTIL